MNTEDLKLKIQDAIKKCGFDVPLMDIVIEHSKDPSHGDYATNVAMKLCKLFGKSPRDVALQIIENLDKTGLDKEEIAGPGFINFFLKADSLTNIISRILKEGDCFGKSPSKGKKINVEFVSANPTGILHVGTARGAAYGDSLARILEWNGYDVTREYYINDAGNQIDHLGESLYARYLEQLGRPFDLPEDGYHGQDVVEIAKKLVSEIQDKGLSMPENEKKEFFKHYAMTIELDRIKKDLFDFGVKHDIFSSEKEIRANKALENELKYLEKYTYIKDGALYLKTTEFLDDKDRVVVKSDGEYTYFMPDIVYHLNKLSRGFDQLIDVLGADHHGYINRMKSALMMHGYSKDILDIELIQMVRFIKDGEEIKASKRTGNAITLREICDEVGVDAMRYFFAMRAPSSHLDFDMNLAVEQSSNNPVYYAQYAHARLCSILSQGKDFNLDKFGTNLTLKSELDICKCLAKFEDVIKDAANERSPFKITNYIHELAELIHVFYNECRVIDSNNISVTESRLALCDASRQIMKNALYLIGVSAPTHM